ncbi:MAG: cyclase family protein [Anaerolineales bacterium]|jgi:arylformamidase
MKIYDISLTISPDLPTWPGDPPIKISRVEKIEEGADANVTQLNMSAHVGTHVDAPYHFLGGDSPTVEKLPLEILHGRAYVLCLDEEIDLITASVLEKSEIPARIRRLLIKTRNSKSWAHDEKIFNKDFVAISEDGAKFIISRGIKLVGVDHLSVAPFTNTIPTHKELLSAGVVIVEGLNLHNVPQGRYSLFCLPLKIKGSDGAPARAILLGA